MTAFYDLISGLEYAVKIFLFIAFVAFSGALLFIFFLLSSRQVKNAKIRRETQLRDRFQRSLNVIMLMESSSTTEQASSQFYVSQLVKDMGNSTLARQVMTDQLIGLRKSLIGSSADNLVSIFRTLKLNDFSLFKLRSFDWKIKAQGIFELAQMDNGESYELIKRSLNSKNVTVREEAFMALVKLDKSNSLSFLNDYHSPMSNWMVMRIHQHLSITDKRTLADFSQWFDHPNLTVALFAMDMARQFRQLSAVSKLNGILNDKEKSKIALAIDTLGELEAYESADHLASCAMVFWNDQVISRKIARSLGKIGHAETHWRLLRQYLHHPEYQVRFEAVQSLSKSGVVARKMLDDANKELNQNLGQLILHVDEPLLQN
ncbi:hypothetical protein WSM22_32380 [Cytophagales bacterium WSM2-2]|nr:hypothetical protein WSM22_32380 [Cytophagales bacterium WSM2-2]